MMSRTVVAWLLGTCTLASLISSSYVDFSRTPTSELTPRKGAFSIWGLIYTLLGASAFTVGSLRRDAVDPTPHVLVSAALATTLAWSLSVGRVRAVALAALAVASLLAWSSLAFVDGREILFSAAYGLLAGWLSVATTLSTERDDTRTLAVASCAIGIASVALGAPWPCASLLWALVTQRRFDATVIASIAIALVAATGSVLPMRG